MAFNQILVELSNQTAVEIVKHEDKDDLVEFVFLNDGVEIERVEYKPDLKQVDSGADAYRFAINRIIDAASTRAQSLDESQKNLPSGMSEELNQMKVTNSQSTAILDSINVYLIKEQRLFKQVKRERSILEPNDSTVMIEAIESYAKELKALINERANKSYEITQKLDSSYPVRLISENGTLTKEQYIAKFAALQQKQEKLVKNGLSETTQEALDFSEDDAKALLVYLNDLEQKLSVFDELVEKLELFTNILNERRFTFKSIKISKDKGFYFETSTGKKLALNQLSSGEQHEVVLLFELIFKTSPSILVLIDEPEISLHITWQKEFLDDLLKIIKLQKFQVLVATHSPAIVNGRWDLVYELNKPQNVESH